MTKISYIRNIKIFDDEYVEKQGKNLEELYRYLDSRDFSYYVPLVRRENDANIYRYVEDYSLDNNQKGQDLIDTLSLLHNKTSFRKEIRANKNKDIYRKLKGYIKYLSDSYRSIMDELEYHEYPSPSEQLFLNNYSKLAACLNFLDSETDAWYKLVKDSHEERVSMIHGKSDLSHIIKNDKNYLISWEQARIETPIIDIIDLYHKEWEHLEFKSLLERYFSKCELSEAEKKLLFINLTIPIKIKDANNEIERTLNMYSFTNYIYKTEDLIRPYYSEKQKEK